MEQFPTIKIAVLGMGTVGGGVCKLLEQQAKEIPFKTGSQIEIKKVLVRNVTKYGKYSEHFSITDRWEEIRDDPEIQIVVEVMGGIEPAKQYILEALEHGKQVVSANKDLIAEHGRELFEAAEKNHCDFLFEASVAGGIPIIRPLKQCLAGNDLTEVIGIVNGTTNYILTKMSKQNMEFQQALEQAQKLGYAEADPTADIEGYDAARKIAIMASIAFHSRVVFSDVYTQGITSITPKDMKYAKEMGCVIKLLAIAKNTPSGIEVRVHPTLIPESHPLASVNDVFNAVFVHGDAADDTMFYGRGAGELPTASAVVGDVIDVARNLSYQCTGRISCSCYKNLPVKPMEECVCKYFVRMQVDDRSGVLASIAGIFGNNRVSISQIIQKSEEDGIAELVVISDEVRERHFMDSLTILKGMSIVKEVSSIIRVYGGSR